MKKLPVIMLAAAVATLFSGCAVSSEPQPTQDLAVYSIYYHAEGGELSPYNPGAYNSLTPSFTLKEPTREGYRFLGWSKSADLGSPVLSVTVPKGTTGNLDFYAVWAQLYTVRIDSATPEFFTIEYVTGPVIYGETAIVHISTAKPVGGLQWYSIGSTQYPESCVYDESLGAFVVSFTLTKNITVMVMAVL